MDGWNYGFKALSTHPQQMMLKKGNLNIATISVTKKRKSALHGNQDISKESKRKKKKVDESGDDDDVDIGAFSDVIPSSSAVVEEFLSTPRQHCKLSFVCHLFVLPIVHSFHSFIHSFILLSFINSFFRSFHQFTHPFS